MKTVREQYPEYFTECFDYSIGKGWEPLIQSLCVIIKSSYEQLKRVVDYANKPNPAQVWLDKLPEAKNSLATFPVKIVQVKEKFGTLRIHIHGGHSEIFTAARALEVASTFICEDCGKPAVGTTSGYIRTLCEDCYNHIVFKEISSGYTKSSNLIRFED